MINDINDNQLLENLDTNSIPEPMLKNDSYIIPVNLINQNNLPNYHLSNEPIFINNLDILLQQDNVNIFLRIVNNNIHVQKEFFTKKRISGKEGQMRNNCMGKRVNQSGRTVIGPDPTLRLDEMVMIKDNHIAVEQSLLSLIDKTKKKYRKFEVDTPEKENPR